jgi:hypothetical protein
MGIVKDDNYSMKRFFVDITKISTELPDLID